MNASELNRKLLYYGHNDVADYLQNSPLNRYLYKQILNNRDSSNKSSVVTIFNEIYYQCVRVAFDINPGENLMHRYIEEEIWWLKSRNDAVLVFFFVWMLLKAKRTLTFNEECFLESLTSILKKSENVEDSLEALLRDMKENDIKVPDEFAQMRYPVVKAIPVQSGDNSALIKKVAGESKKMVKSFINIISPENDYQPNPNAWMELTDNYSHAWIEKYAKLYPDTNDRLAILERIECSIPRSQRKKHEDFFVGLRMHIESGQVVYKALRDEDMDNVKEWIEVGIRGTGTFIHTFGTIYSLKNRYPCVA